MLIIIYMGVAVCRVLMRLISVLLVSVMQVGVKDNLEYNVCSAWLSIIEMVISVRNVGKIV